MIVILGLSVPSWLRQHGCGIMDPRFLGKPLFVSSTSTVCSGTLWYTCKKHQKAIENGPVEIVDLPIEMVIFHSYLS